MSKNKYGLEIFFCNLVFHLRLSAPHVYYTHVCKVSKVIGINAKNKISLPNKKYIGDY